MGLKSTPLPTGKAELLVVEPLFNYLISFILGSYRGALSAGDQGATAPTEFPLPTAHILLGTS